MALTKPDLMTLYNLLSQEAYAEPISPDVSWDGAGQRRDGRLTQILAVLLNILQAVDSGFAPPGSGVQAPALTDYNAPSGVIILPTGTYQEVTIYITPGSAGTIEGTAVIAGLTYIYRADSGKALDDLTFECTTGTFHVLTITA